MSEQKTPNLDFMGLERIAEEEHLKRALASEEPHAYIAARAGQREYEGEPGIGFCNASRLHADVILDGNYDLSAEENKQDIWNTFKEFGSSFSKETLRILAHKDAKKYEELVKVICENDVTKGYFEKLRNPPKIRHFPFD
ncbi:MAG: hypothetical protein MRY79_06550 [Alphaproteobacteria bacterium]|nr:hypothetical protein [Alphaproteobacteria bacterium]